MPLPQTRLSSHIRQSCGRGTDGRRDWWWRRCKGRGRSQTCPPRRTGQRDGQGRRSWEPVWTRDAEWQYPYRLNRVGLGLLRSPTLLRFLGKGRCVCGNSKGQVCCLKDKCWARVCLKRREWVQFHKPKSKWESSRRRRSIAKEREWIEWDPTSEQLVVPLCRALAALYTWMAERGALDGIPLEWHYLMVGTAAVSRIIGARSFGPRHSIGSLALGHRSWREERGIASRLARGKKGGCQSKPKFGRMDWSVRVGMGKWVFGKEQIGIMVLWAGLRPETSVAPSHILQIDMKTGNCFKRCLFLCLSYWNNIT